MARQLTLSLARLGWAMAEDLKAIVSLIAGMVIASAPLLAWHLFMQQRYRDVVQYVPPAFVLLLLAAAGVLSGIILYRWYRFLLHCRVC